MTDAKLHFEKVGSGEPAVVLLHGMMFDGTVFAELADHLATSHEVITVDLPGFGRSSPPSEFSPTALAAPVARLLRDRGGAPAAIVGWSMGAAVAMQLAVEHPGLVDRLILSGATPCLVQQPDWPYGLPAEESGGLGELLMTDWEAGTEAFVGRVASRGDDAVRARLGAVARRSRPESALAVFEAARDLDQRPLLDRIEAPAHLIVGAEDIVCPRGAGEYLAERLDGPLSVIEGADHVPFLTAPERFANVVDEALGDGRPSATA
jgi:pimeloyl-[acyl-carrier protein] methyl ester esterase